MSVLAIVQPLPFVPLAASSSAGQGLGHVLTPDPREAFVAAGMPIRITLDLGAVVPIDTVFVGFTDAAADAAWSVAVDPGFRQVHLGRVAHSYRRAPLRHGLLALGAPVATRFVRIEVAATAIGVVAVGRALRPAGHDWGSGRPVQDGSRVDPLPGGGYGVASGATRGGWQWAMPGLDDEMVDRLYALQLDTGIGGDILVAEHTDGGPGFNEAIHWGKLTRLEPFARQAPGDTKWAMQVQDW